MPSPSPVALAQREAHLIATGCDALLSVHARMEAFRYVDTAIRSRWGLVTARLLALGTMRLEQIADTLPIEQPPRANAEPPAAPVDAADEPVDDEPVEPVDDEPVEPVDAADEPVDETPAEPVEPVDTSTTSEAAPAAGESA